MALNLPPELISCFAANIDTVYNLAQCSRQLYLCTIPLLYRHVTVPAGIDFIKPRLHRQLETFASLVLRRPDLARLVRSLTLQLLPESSEGFELVGVDQVFKTAVKALSLSKEEKNHWLRRLGFGCKDVNLALLLLALLKVEKL
ncbi:hypothetical protein MMC29_004444, partial [Sticta canariensis]|nr:hypothetical protein [Sticta canariensis]